MSKHKERRVTVSRARSEQGVGGIVIPEDATVADVSLDGTGEHGTVTYWTEEIVEVDDDGDE